MEFPQTTDAHFAAIVPRRAVPEFRPGAGPRTRESFKPGVTETLKFPMFAGFDQCQKGVTLANTIEQKLAQPRGEQSLTAEERAFLQQFRATAPRASAEELVQVARHQSHATAVLWFLTMIAAETSGARGLVDAFVKRYGSDKGFLGTLTRLISSGDPRAQEELVTILSTVPPKVSSVAAENFSTQLQGVVMFYTTEVTHEKLTRIHATLNRKGNLDIESAFMIEALGLTNEDWTVAEAEVRCIEIVDAWMQTISTLSEMASRSR